MDPRSKRQALIYGGALAVLFVFWLLQSGILVLLGNALPIEGKVLSVAASSSSEREAEVRLSLGPVVKASVPGACVVFPGQTATINFTGPLIGREPAFRLWEAWDKQ
jgi:hypothetical protein